MYCDHKCVTSCDECQSKNFNFNKICVNICPDQFFSCFNICVPNCDLCFGATGSREDVCVSAVHHESNPWNQSGVYQSKISNKLQVVEYKMNQSVVRSGDTLFICENSIECLECPFPLVFDSKQNVCIVCPIYYYNGKCIDECKQGNDQFFYSKTNSTICTNPLEKKNDIHLKKMCANGSYYCDLMDECVWDCYMQCDINWYYYCGMQCTNSCLSCEGAIYFQTGLSYQDYNMRRCQTDCPTNYSVYSIASYQSIALICSNALICTEETIFPNSTVECQCPSGQKQCEQWNYGNYEEEHFSYIECYMYFGTYEYEECFMEEEKTICENIFVKNIKQSWCYLDDTYCLSYCDEEQEIQLVTEYYENPTTFYMDITCVDSCDLCLDYPNDNGDFCGIGCASGEFMLEEEESYSCVKECPQKKYFIYLSPDGWHSYPKCTTLCEEEKSGTQQYWIIDNNKNYQCGNCSYGMFLERKTQQCLMQCKIVNCSNYKDDYCMCEDEEDKENCPMLNYDQQTQYYDCVRQCDYFYDRKTGFCLYQCLYVNMSHEVTLGALFVCEAATDYVNCPFTIQQKDKSFLCVEKCPPSLPYVMNNLGARQCIDTCPTLFVDTEETISCVDVCGAKYFTLEEEQLFCATSCSSTLFNSTAYFKLYELSAPQNFPVDYLFCAQTQTVRVHTEKSFYFMLCWLVFDIIFTAHAIYRMTIAILNKAGDQLNAIKIAKLDGTILTRYFSVIRKISSVTRKRCASIMLLAGVKTLMCFITFITAGFVTFDPNINNIKATALIPLAIYGIFLIAFIILSTVYTLTKQNDENKKKNEGIDMKYYSAHIFGTLFSAANALLGFILIFCDITQFFTLPFFKPSFTSDIWVYAIPNKLLQASIFCFNANVSYYFLFVPLVIQILTDIDTKHMKAVQKGIMDGDTVKRSKKNKKQDVKEVGLQSIINVDMFYTKLALYIISIATNTCLVILQWFFSNLFGQYPLLEIMLIPILYMFSNLKFVHFYQFRKMMYKNIQVHFYASFSNLLKIIYRCKIDELNIGKTKVQNISQRSPFGYLFIHMIVSLARYLLLLVLIVFDVVIQIGIIIFIVVASVSRLYVDFIGAVFFPFQFFTEIFGCCIVRNKEKSMQQIYQTKIGIFFVCIASAAFYSALIIFFTESNQYFIYFGLEIIVLSIAFIDLINYYNIFSNNYHCCKETALYLEQKIKQDEDNQDDFLVQNKELQIERKHAYQYTIQSKSITEVDQIKVKHWLVNYQVYEYVKCGDNDEPYTVKSEDLGQFYQSLQLMCYSNIPYVGSLIVDFSILLNSPPLVAEETLIIPKWYTIVSLCMAFTYFYSVFYYVGGSNMQSTEPNPKYIPFVIITLALGLACAQDDGSHIIPEESRMNVFQMLFCCCMKKKINEEDVPTQQNNWKRTIHTIKKDNVVFQRELAIDKGIVAMNMKGVQMREAIMGKKMKFEGDNNNQGKKTKKTEII